MPTTIYFTAVIAATGKKHSIAIPDTYSMKNLRGMLSARTKIALKKLQLSRNGKLLPHRFRETVTSAGIRGGWQVLVSSKKDAVSGSLSCKRDEERSFGGTGVRGGKVVANGGC